MEQKGKVFFGWWIVVASFFFMFAGLGILVNTYGVLFGAIIQTWGSRVRFRTLFHLDVFSINGFLPNTRKIDC